MQCGFLSGRGTVCVVFILRRLTEKYEVKAKKLFCVFIDLENRIGQMLVKVFWYALKKRGVTKYIVQGIMLLYSVCKAAVFVDGELSDLFFGQVGDC